MTYQNLGKSWKLLGTVLNHLKTKTFITWNIPLHRQCSREVRGLGSKTRQDQLHDPTNKEEIYNDLVEAAGINPLEFWNRFWNPTYGSFWPFLPSQIYYLPCKSKDEVFNQRLLLVFQTSKVGSALLSSKARKVSSLVQKWQSIKQQEEPALDSSEDEEEHNDPVRQIEEWKKVHLERYLIV